MTGQIHIPAEPIALFGVAQEFQLWLAISVGWGGWMLKWKWDNIL
jgi:hypothetical protein